MSIWNKILIGFIFVASILFGVLAARALKTHQYWRDQAGRFEQELKAEDELHGELVNGSEDGTQPGLRRLTVEVRALMVDRGRVWRNCSPQQVQATEETVQLTLTTDLPDPHGIKPRTVLFLFEETPVEDGGRYLGQFTVTAEAGKRIQLQASMKLNDRQIQHLQARRGPWSLYEVMPVDQNEMLAELDEVTIRAMFPDSTEGEYLAAKQAEEGPGGPPADQPARRLRDYEVLFRQYHKEWSIWIDETGAVGRDLQDLQAAVADARQQVQFRQNEIDQLKQESARIARERDTVAAHRQALEAKLAEVQTGVDELVDGNRKLAGEIAQIQLEATRRIDERTRAMATLEGGS